jgi:two-component system LytT family response regulator
MPDTTYTKKMKKLPETVIIEDEPESLNLLVKLIDDSGLLKVAGMTTDPTTAEALICNMNPDLVFLDIRMPGKDGFQIIDDLRKRIEVLPYFVFTTAYNEFAIKAFEYAAFDYLLKPIEPDRLVGTIYRFMERKASGERQKNELLIESFRKLLFRNASGIVVIDPAEVIHVKADGNYSVFLLTDEKIETVTSLLHKVESQLPPEKFFRVSRSAIINLDYLKRINTRQQHCLLRKDGTEYRVEISHDRIKELIDIMKMH